MKNTGYELFDHKADMGLRGSGTSPAEAFEQAALAFTAIMTDPEKVDSTIKRHFKCDAPSLDILLYEWINALVYVLATEKLIFGHFMVHIQKTSLEAEAWGETIDANKHSPVVEIKGATFTELKVNELYNNQWIAQCVVDV